MIGAGTDTSWLDPGALVGGSVNDPDPVARAATLQKLEQLDQPQSQPVPGLPHGAIPGLLGVAMNGGASAAPGLSGGMWRPNADARFVDPPAPMAASAPIPFTDASGAPSVPPAPPAPAGASPATPAPPLNIMPGRNAMASASPADAGAQPPASQAPTPDRSLIPSDSLLGRLFNNIGNYRDQNRLTLLALAGGLAGSQNWGTGLSRGFQAAVPAQMQDIALRNQNATMNVLQGYGMSPDMARAVSANPQMLQSVLGQAMGTAPPAHIMVKNMMGGESPYIWNAQTRKFEPATMGSPGLGAGGGAGLGAGGYPNNVSPEQWNGMSSDQRLSTLDPVLASEVKAVHEGTAAVPGRQPFVMGVAKMVYPGFDENDFTAAKNMTTELQKSSNSSMGGILSNGFSAFDHLADTSAGMVGVGGWSGPNIPGGSMVGSAYTMGRSALASPDLTAAISQERNSALRYGQEGTKFYAATGGGEGERTFALNNSTGASVTPAAKAGFLRSEVQLMGDRMNEKLAQVEANPAGAKWLQAHAGQIQKMNDNITRIKQNIAKLDPNGPEAAEIAGRQPVSSAPAQAPATATTPAQLPPGWSVQVR